MISILRVHLVDRNGRQFVETYPFNLLLRLDHLLILYLVGMLATGQGHGLMISVGVVLGVLAVAGIVGIINFLAVMVAV